MADGLFSCRASPKCGSCHIARRAEILGTARPSCSCRAGTAQNISCRAVLWVVPNDRAAARPKMAWPKSQLYVLCFVFNNISLPHVKYNPYYKCKILIF